MIEPPFIGIPTSVKPTNVYNPISYYNSIQSTTFHNYLSITIFELHKMILLWFSTHHKSIQFTIIIFKIIKHYYISIFHQSQFTLNSNPFFLLTSDMIWLNHFFRAYNTSLSILLPFLFYFSFTPNE
jgi:hypothetical protein